ncbi:MAG: holo-ACP synthase [Acidimicrobiales bacterium]
MTELHHLSSEDRAAVPAVEGMDPRIVRAGVDRVDVAEFGRILATGGDEFLRIVYTVGEREHCDGRVDRLAARFAAKEAVLKALGTGLRGIALCEIEVVSDPDGQPLLVLHGRARTRADALQIISMSVSLTHTTVAAEALVVALAADSSSDSPLPKEGTL